MDSLFSEMRGREGGIGRVFPQGLYFFVRDSSFIPEDVMRPYMQKE